MKSFVPSVSGAGCLTRDSGVTPLQPPKHSRGAAEGLLCFVTGNGAAADVINKHNKIGGYYVSFTQDEILKSIE